MGAAGLDARCGIWHRTALVDMRGTWDEYFAGRNGKFRNNVRRQQRKVAQLGNAVYLRCRPLGEAAGDGDPRLHLYDACVDLARRSWQGSSTSGTTLSHASVAGFLREVHVLAARAGAVDMNLLELDGRPVAFAYNYCWQGRVFGLRAGYDPAAADAGVGTVLFAQMLRDSFERGDERLDLGTGYLEGKRHWLTRVADCCRVTHYPISEPRVQLLRVKHWLDRTLAGTAS
jgi:CelD/BcsL family acetyltransferase involved in cellulose biosynthesis